MLPGLAARHALVTEGVAAEALPGGDAASACQPHGLIIEARVNAVQALQFRGHGVVQLSLQVE